MKIAMLYPNQPAFGVDTHDREGIGGSESGFIRTVQHLVAMGHQVSVFNQQLEFVDYGPDLKWGYIGNFDPRVYYDIVYSLRHKEPFDLKPNAKLKVLFLADTESHGLINYIKDGRINLVMAVSHWQKEKISREEQIHDSHWHVSSNGIQGDTEFRGEVADKPKVRGRCLFLATPDRGLDNLIAVWPRIKAAVPHATLHVYSSYIGWRMPKAENDAQLADFYGQLEALPGVVNKKHGTVEEIRVAQKEAELYIYPTDFYETRCMSVLESMYCGAIPVVTGRGALLEMVVNGVTGYTVPAYGASTDRYQKLFIAAVTKALTLDGITKMILSENAARYASQFLYARLVEDWVGEWRQWLARDR